MVPGVVTLKSIMKLFSWSHEENSAWNSIRLEIELKSSVESFGDCLFFLKKKKTMKGASQERRFCKLRVVLFKLISRGKLVERDQIGTWWK